MAQRLANAENKKGIKKTMTLERKKKKKTAKQELSTTSKNIRQKKRRESTLVMSCVCVCVFYVRIDSWEEEKKREAS
jgi:hypothetical protein